MGLVLIQITPSGNKTRQWRGLPINETCAQAIRDIRSWHREHGLQVERLFVRRDGTPLKHIGEKSFRTACGNAGLTDLTMSDLRHVAATSLIKAGASLMEVKELLGHKSIETTMIYAHLMPESARSTVERLDDSAEKLRKLKIV